MLQDIQPDLLNLNEDRKRKGYPDVPVWASILIGIILYIGILWLIGVFNKQAINNESYPDDREQWCGPGGSSC